MKVVLLAAVVAAFVAGTAAAQQSEILGPIDGAVNALLGAAGVANREASRVVPIVGAGGTAEGYAQIIGAQSRVAATRAVVKLSANAPNGWRIDTLVPVTAISRAGGTLHREYGVAVDAVVNLQP